MNRSNVRNFILCSRYQYANLKINMAQFICMCMENKLNSVFFSYFETLLCFQITFARYAQTNCSQDCFGYFDGRLHIEHIYQLGLTVFDATRKEINVPLHILVKRSG